nr:hypothetical protein [Tanacetum cinerariifolium]
YDNSSPRPPKEFVSKNSYAEIESFSPSHIPYEDSDSFMEEIDLSFNLDDPMPPSIEDDGDDSERDILILEELPSNYSFSLLEIESFCFDIPLFSRPPAKPPNELLSNDSLSLPENESFYFDIPSSSRPPAKPPNDDSEILTVKVVDDISKLYVPMPRFYPPNPPSF